MDSFTVRDVMPRKRHVSRNVQQIQIYLSISVMPRKRHVSRNCGFWDALRRTRVMPRKRHVSRNMTWMQREIISLSCLVRGM